MLDAATLRIDEGHFRVSRTLTLKKRLGAKNVFSENEF